MTAIPGVPITGVIVPQDTADVYPVLDPKYQLGGWRTVATTAERDAIPPERRTLGMQVYSADTDQTYRLIGGLANANWSGSSGAVAAHTHPESDIIGLVADLAAKAPLASPTFTGAPAAPTAAPGTSTTQLASTAFVAAALAALVGGAPVGLDTLAEIASSLGADPAFATTVSNALALKAPLASPLFTGVPAGPTAANGTNTTQLATTAFVLANAVTGGGAPLASPAFTGVPTAPTAANGVATTQLATTLFVANAVAALVNSAPGTLDTLGEIATEIGNINTSLANKQPLNSNLTAAAGLTGVADRVPYFTGAAALALATFNALGRSIVGAASAGLARRAINAGVVALTDGATINTDCSLGNFFTVTVNGNRTFAAPTNMQAGATYCWAITQGVGGNFHSSFSGTAFHQFAGDVFNQSTAAGLTDLVTAISPDGAKLFVTTISGYT